MSATVIFGGHVSGGGVNTQHTLRVHTVMIYQYKILDRDMSLIRK